MFFPAAFLLLAGCHLKGLNFGASVDQAAPADSADTETPDTGAEPDEGGCEPEIPASAVLVRGVETLSEGAAWVCPYGVATATGDGLRLYLEPGASASLAGVGGEVWVKAGASVSLSASGVTVWAEEGATVLSAGESSRRTCPALEFLAGPVPGCS